MWNIVLHLVQFVISAVLCSVVQCLDEMNMLEWYGIGIDLFEFGISTVHCTTCEDPNDMYMCGVLRIILSQVVGLLYSMQVHSCRS